MLAVGAIGVQAASTPPLADADPSAALVASIAFLGSVLLSTLGFLVVGRNDESWEPGDRRLLWASALCSGAGVLVCLAGLSLGIEPWELFVTCLLVLMAVGLLAAVAGRLLAAPKGEGLSEWMRTLGQRWLYVVTGVVSLLLLGVVGWLFWNGAKLAPGVPVKSYPVYLTCADGVCSVNECASPKACGKQAVGRLEEGEMAEITCQTHGGLVPVKDPGGSRVWDKLLDGNYVTDYYIETPKSGRFTPGIPRCPEGSEG
jgi:hypothetical protein